MFSSQHLRNSTQFLAFHMIRLSFCRLECVKPRAKTMFQVDAFPDRATSACGPVSRDLPLFAEQARSRVNHYIGPIATAAFMDRASTGSPIQAVWGRRIAGPAIVVFPQAEIGRHRHNPVPTA